MYSYSYSNFNGTLVGNAPMMDVIKGTDNAILDIPDSIELNDEWLETTETELGLSIVEQDCKHRNNVNVQILNISKIS